MTPIDDRIASWLLQLEQELASDDPALRHDAMTDAREHLTSARAELPIEADDAQVEQLVLDYGTPAEVAESYRAADRLLHDGHAPAAATTAPMPVAADAAEPGEPAAAAPQPSWFGVVRDPDAWAAVVYLLLALPLGIAWFTWTVTAGATSGSLLVLIIGIPLVLAFLASIRGIALLDGRIVETLLGERMPRRSRAAADDGESSGLVDRLKYWVTDRRTWSSIVYLLTMLPLGVTYFTIAITLGSIGVGLVTGPIVLAIAAGVDDVRPDAWVWPIALALVPVGALVLVSLLHLARGIGGLHGAYAKAMLVGGDGAARRRRPVSIGGSFGRGLALAAGALALGGIAFGIGAAITRSSTEEVTREASASGVSRIELDIRSADVTLAEDRDLDDGEIRVEARMRTSTDTEETGAELRIDTSGGTATVFVDCDTFVWFVDGCDSNVVVHVPPGGDIELGGRTSSGDIELDGAFSTIEVETGSGDIDGRLDARDVDLRTGSGDIDVVLTDEVERISLETGSGDVSVEAPGTWDVDVETGSGDEDIEVPRDGDADRTMRLRTGSGDVEVASP